MSDQLKKAVFAIVVWVLYSQLTTSNAGSVNVVSSLQVERGKKKAVAYD